MPTKSYKLKSMDVTFLGVTRNYDFGNEGPDLGDHDSEYDAQMEAYRLFKDELETTETIVVEGLSKAVSVDVTVEYTVRGSVSLTIDLDEDMEPYESDLVDFVDGCEGPLTDAIESEVRYADIQYDNIAIDRAYDHEGEELELL
jgi:hypothetical protein